MNIRKHKNMIQFNSNDEKWFKCLIQFNGKICIEKNIRYRISKYPFNKELWILYIQYLKKSTNLQAMLKTYFRYCRLFFKNEIMLEKYRSEIESAGFDGECVTKFWIDTIEFERVFVSEESAGEILKRSLKSGTIGPKGLIRYAQRFCKKYPNIIEFSTIKEGIKKLMDFNFQHKKSCSLNFEKDFCEESFIEIFLLQQFPTVIGKIKGRGLPEILIFNIITKSSIKLLQKLFQTCTYYNAILRRLTCYNLTITGESKFGIFGQTLFLPATKTSLNFKAIFLTNRLRIISRNSKLLSNLLPKITHCKIRLLNLVFQVITLKEFKFLTINTNIEDFNFEKGKIIDENGMIASIEKTVSLVPKAFNIKKVYLKTFFSLFLIYSCFKKIL